MNEQDKNEFTKHMISLSEMFNKEVTKPLARMYFDALSEYSVEQIGQAVNEHIKTGRFFPKPVELSDIINRGKPNNKDKALLAWMSVERAISAIGPYRTLTLDDRLASKIVEHVGGWSNMCKLTTKELEFKKRDFIEAYTTTALTSDKELPKSLAGLHDIAKLENKAKS